MRPQMTKWTMTDDACSRQDSAGSTSCTNCPTSGSYSPPGATSSTQCLSDVAGGLATCAASTTDGSCRTSSPPVLPSAQPTHLPRIIAAVGGAVISQAAPVRRRGPVRRACPSGSQSCPVYGTTLRRRGYLKGYECVEVQRDLESCGGCVAHDSPFGERTAGGGRDCSAIPHADGVKCQNGVCVIGA